MHSRNDLGPFLAACGLYGEGVEVGVWRGEFSRTILDAWPGKRLWGVDPWTPQPTEEYQDVLAQDAAGHDADLLAAREKLAPHGERWTALRMTSREAAGRFTDGSLDFVYIDANHRYEAVKEDLRLWWPKVKPNGTFAGHDFLDGVMFKSVFGVRTAVQEFAHRRRLRLYLTLDTPQSWWMVKRAPTVREWDGSDAAGTENGDRSLTLAARKGKRYTPRIAVMTAYDDGYAELGKIAAANARAYCERYGYAFLEITKGFDLSRPASWSKLLFLKEHLAHHDWILWTDVDALIMNHRVKLEEIIDDECDVILPHDDIGVGVTNVNTGNFLIRNTDFSKEFLDMAWQQEEFIHDRLWENRAIIHLLFGYNLSGHVRIVPQRRMNSYPGNYQKGDFILHFADAPPKQRADLLRRYVQFAG